MLLCIHMPAFLAARSTENLLSVSLQPSLCPQLSLGLHPSVPVPQLWSFHHLYLSLVSCAFSPHRFISSHPCHHPPFPFRARLPLSSFSEPPSCIPPSSYPPITPIMPPFLDSILLLPLLPPSRRPSSCHHVIMPFRFVTFCFLLGIYNPLQISLSVLCSLCAAFHLLCMK